jgi:hypothetical protein
MDPLRAYRNTNVEWSVRFKVRGADLRYHVRYDACVMFNYPCMYQVIKDTGTIYFRRFVFAAEDGACWYVKEWSENPELPPGKQTSTSLLKSRAEFAKLVQAWTMCLMSWALLSS